MVIKKFDKIQWQCHVQLQKLIQPKIIKMILYNVTINIHESVHEQWLNWMHTKHINDVLATGKFISARLVKVLVEEEMGGITYAIQYTTDSKETLQRYYDEDASRLREEGNRLFGEKMLAFRTELEFVSEFFNSN